MEDLEKEGWIKVLKTGSFCDSAGRLQVFDTARLQEIADRYKPTECEIPCIIGHNFSDETEAKGWVAEIKRVGNLLWAKPKELSADVIEKLKTKAFKYVSMSLKKDNTPRHLAFVSSPAVKGLGPIPASVYANFSDGENIQDIVHLSFDFSELDADAVNGKFIDIGAFFRKLREYFIEKDGIEKIDQVIPEYSIKFISEYPVIKTEQIEGQAITNYSENMEVNMKDQPGQDGQPNTTTAVDLAAEVAVLKITTAAQDAKLRAYEQEKREGEVANFAEELTKKGILYPNKSNAFKAVMLKLYDVTDAPVNFSDAGGAAVSLSAVEAFKSIFEGIQPTLPLTPLKDLKKGTSLDDPLEAQFAEFSDVNADDLELDKAARAIAKEQNIPYDQALNIAMRR